MDSAEHEPGLDSLGAEEALRGAGFKGRQARAPRLREGRLAGVVRDGRRGLATKADLDAGFDNLERRLLLAIRAGNAELKTDLLKWFVGSPITLAGVIVAIVR